MSTRTYRLMAADGSFYQSPTPGELAGHAPRKIFGRLTCPSALARLAKSGYRENRVFFADEAAARAAGYRPCARCLPAKYKEWRDAAPAWAERGSQLWLQVAVNRCPEAIDQSIRTALRLDERCKVEWVSPLENERFVEYRDNAALQKLGVAAQRRALSDFWPTGGPVWDGLAKVGSGEVLLVEAKAHIAELVSPASRASEPSRGQIAKSLAQVRNMLAPAAEVDWAGTFYQYANRVAHLHFLREDNGIPAHLVFVNFLNDSDMGGPSHKESWEAATEVVERYLGLGRHRLRRWIHHFFVDVDQLRPFAPTGADLGRTAAEG